jgi:hypothetical protein
MFSLMSAETLFHGEKREVEQQPAASVPRDRRAASRGLRHFFLRPGRNGRMHLIAVGDRMAKIAWFSLQRSDGSRIDWHTGDIAKVSGSMLPKHDPQIEAVCADGRGRVLLLQETPPRVELIDPEALSVVASINLAVEGRGEIARAWSDEGVARRRNGATARRTFARRQGEEAGGFH